ncbi:MAG: MerR family transcriptional regulator [Ilumatobacteraceae bacterium]
MNEQGYSGTQAAKVVGITYRQLDYWARTDLVTPSLASAKGSGSRRLYSYRDLLELRVVRTLLDAGIELPRGAQGVRVRASARHRRHRRRPPRHQRHRRHALRR